MDRFVAESRYPGEDGHGRRAPGVACVRVSRRGPDTPDVADETLDIALRRIGSKLSVGAAWQQGCTEQRRGKCGRRSQNVQESLNTSGAMGGVRFSSRCVNRAASVRPTTEPNSAPIMVSENQCCPSTIRPAPIASTNV